MFLRDVSLPDGSAVAAAIFLVTLGAVVDLFARLRVDHGTTELGGVQQSRGLAAVAAGGSFRGLSCALFGDLSAFSVRWTNGLRSRIGAGTAVHPVSSLGSLGNETAV